MDKGKINVLIIGGLGFIGWNTAIAMLKDGNFNVNILDKKYTDFDDLQNPDIAIIDKTHTRDIAKKDPFDFYVDDGMEIERADVVLHLGEFARVEQSFDNMFEVLESNVVGTSRVIQEYLRQCPDAVFIYAGSSTRWSTPGAYLQSPYAFTKSKNAELIGRIGDWLHCRTFTTYFYNVFGEGENSDEVNGTVVGRFVDAYQKNEKLNVYGGDQTRRFTYIGDVTKNIIHLIKTILTDISLPKSFHFVSRQTREISINELARMFYDDDSMINYFPHRSGCRIKSADYQQITTPYGVYNVTVQDYINIIKRLPRNE